MFAEKWNHCGRSKASMTEHHGKVFEVHIVRYTWVLVAKDKSNRLVLDSLRSVPQESWSRTTSSGKTNNWRNREHVVLDLFSNWKCVRSKGFVGEPLGSSGNPTWANSGEQNWRWHLACSVCCVVCCAFVRCVCLRCWCAMCGCWCVLVLVCHPHAHHMTQQ